MAYDATKDPLQTSRGSAFNFGSLGRVVTPNDNTDLDPYAKSLVVTAAGNLVIIPVQNDDAAPITFTGLSAGQVIPYRVRRVKSTGTTASVATIDV
ncbi:hypothetical protein [Bradyrhizobium sp. PRIMUS42]|uniref:spike base protein, RCAP_Rcc01079 family n=1 Tax=Bradyrhizobium sp. PRIMUS42 TaxID=2908926 RepID=UPI001FF15410|nr:hypothetical protein [Bradyrhizobium sp. PRIMUS42]MCJ9729550.1 hypothetical protein [Bradyrhizobium sp. PRIMUS42]